MRIIKLCMDKVHFLMFLLKNIGNTKYVYFIYWFLNPYKNMKNELIKPDDAIFNKKINFTHFESTCQVLFQDQDNV